MEVRHRYDLGSFKGSVVDPIPDKSATNRKIGSGSGSKWKEGSGFLSVCRWQVWNVWNMSLFEYFFKVLKLRSGSSSKWKVPGRIRIRINVIRISNTAQRGHDLHLQWLLLAGKCIGYLHLTQNRLSQEWLLCKKDISMLWQEKGKNPGPNPDLLKSRNPDSIGSNTCEQMSMSYFLPFS